MIDNELSCMINADFMNKKNISEYLARRSERLQELSQREDEDHIISLNKDLLGEQTSCYKKRKYVFSGLKELLDNFQMPDNITVFLHGSYATGDITSFSDIDIALIINSENLCYEDLQTTRSLVKLLKRYIYGIDPTMHHGIDVFDKKYFQAYDESVLPVNTLENAVLLYGKSVDITLSVDRNLSIKNARNKLVEKCNALLKYDENYINFTPYRMKCIMSVLFLIPVLLLQANKGVFLYKRSALLKSKNEYKELNFSVVDTATQMRERWNASNTSLAVRKVLFWIYPIIPSLAAGQRLSGCFFPFSRKESIEFISEAKIFARQVNAYVKS